MLKRSTFFAGTILLVLLCSALNAQIIFREDFNGSTFQFNANWNVTAGGKWSVRNGRAYNVYDGTGSRLATTRKFTENAYVLETRANNFQSGYFRQYSFMFGKTSAQGEYGYVIRYQPYQNQGLILGRSSGNEYSPTILAQANLVIDPDAVVRLRVEKTANGVIRVFINTGNGYSATPILQATDNTYPALGHLGWRIDTEEAAKPFYVSYVEVRKFPTVLLNPVTSTGVHYDVGILSSGYEMYRDRPYVFETTPFTSEGMEFIQPGNSEKTNTDPDFLTFTLSRPATVYVLYDPRQTRKPLWLNGWFKRTLLIYTNDPGVFYMSVYSKDFPAGNVTLGGNLSDPADGALTNYIVAVPIGPPLRLAVEEKAEQKMADEPVLTTFPNPAVTSASISYELAQDGPVKISLYDANGRPNGVMLESNQKAGKYTKELDIKNLQSGQYIYRFEAGAQQHSGKLVIFR